MSSERIKKLCDYMDQNKAKNYPIENAMLYESEDFIKNGYLRMLAVVLQVGNNITEGQLNLYKRIVEGASAENTTEEYMRQAMEIEIQEYTDFVNSCKEEQLRYRFVLDAILLAADGDNKEGQLKFIASFCEDIKMSKEELDYLASMAKAILEQSEAEYVDTFVEKSLEDISENLFAEYMNAIFDRQDKIYASDNAVLFRPLSESDITATSIKAIQQAKQPYVRIIGANINLAEWKLDLTITGKKCVCFENCVFSGKGKHEIISEGSIVLKDCEEVFIDDCKFDKFDIQVLKIRGIGNLQINNSKFINCSYCCGFNRDGFAGVIHSNDPKSNSNIKIKECEFKQCGCREGVVSDDIQCISNCDTELERCSLIECCYIYRCTIDETKNISFLKNGCQDDGYYCSTLFTSNSKAINCTFENSAKFN